MTVKLKIHTWSLKLKSVSIWPAKYLVSYIIILMFGEAIQDTAKFYTPLALGVVRILNVPLQDRKTKLILECKTACVICFVSHCLLTV